MPSQRDPGTKSEEGVSRASSIGGPVLAVGAFAAGAAVTLVAKRLVDARRKAGRERDELDVGHDGSKEDLAAVLRRAALDVAVAASPVLPPVSQRPMAVVRRTGGVSLAVLMYEPPAMRSTGSGLTSPPPKVRSSADWPERATGYCGSTRPSHS